MSEKITSISKALLKAQKEMSSAKKGSNNPFFKSKYADLGAVLEACKDALNENGIIILQPVKVLDGETYVETVLMHESGEKLSSTMKLVDFKNDMQKAGSAITYARRYTLQSLVSLPAEDDDGNKASDKPAQNINYPIDRHDDITEGQKKFLYILMKEANKPQDEAYNKWLSKASKKQAKAAIDKLKTELGKE